jgi:phospholipase A2
MPVLTTIRQSPAYLYLKTYCLCAIITLFQASPVSSGLSQIRDIPHLSNHWTVPKNLQRDVSTSPSKTSSQLSANKVGNIALHDTSPKPSSPSESQATRPAPRKTRQRWLQRAVDLAQVKKLLKNDDKDTRSYPELDWDASVRRSSSLHPEEQRFIRLRKHRISSLGANSLHYFLILPENEQVDPRDVPLIALGGSGGGYRAMYGFAAFISASKRLGLWDCLTWTAGVSGSCWTLAAYYTIASHDISRLIRHYLSVAKELAHPMSLRGFATVVRSSKGIYFLIGPLVRKVRSGIIGLGIMDLYGTQTTTFQFLSREPGARLSKATFQFSKVWTRSGIDKGIEPMPIFTAVRKAPKDSSGVKPHTDSSLSKGQPPSRALTQHQTKVPSVIAGFRGQPDGHLNPAIPQKSERVEQPDGSLIKGFFQWFEISPLEIGSHLQGYIPTWSWGRSFVSGHSVGRPPEQSLSLMLGQCTSAPAGPLTGYISAILASLPKGTIMSRILLLLNDFVRMKRWKHTWGNPIRAAHDPNPFYGYNNGILSPPKENVEARSHTQTSSEVDAAILQNLSTSFSHIDHEDLQMKNPALDINRGNMFHSGSNSNESPVVASDLDSNVDSDIISTSTHIDKDNDTNTRRWEAEGRIRLMDGGMSNNLPNHILARPERCANIILAFDASSDVQKGSAIQRIQNFADDCHLALEDQTASFDQPEPHFSADADGARSAGLEVESKFLHHYAKVFRGERDNGEEIWLIYCPLLPSGDNPSFDPSVSVFFPRSYKIR